MIFLNGMGAASPALPPRIVGKPPGAPGKGASSGMSTGKKLLLLLAVALPVGYLGYRFIKKRKAATS